ncbi:MAG: hypothetical protein ACRC7N_04800 [Clostridium sp.]
MNGKNISTGGILVALTILTLYLTNIIPINTLALLTLASCFVPIALIKCDIKTALVVYISSTLISFFILPFNIAICYGGFFGLYGLIKFFIEKLRKLPLEVLLKFIFFNIMGLILFNFMQGFLVFDSSLSIIFIIFVEVAFIIYDYALTLLITIYLNKIHPRIR